MTLASKHLSLLYAFIAGLLTAIIAAAAAWFLWPSDDSADDVDVQPARIADIRQMLSLCSTEIYEELPIRGHYGSKHLVAKATLTGSITFDLDRLRTDSLGDTIVIYLPPEHIELRESTEPGAYTVIDTWNERLLGDGLTAREENAIKKRAMEMAENRIRARGHVARARTDAANTLARFTAAATGRPVRVIVNPER